MAVASQTPQTETFSVRLPNGQVLDNVPVGTTKSQIQAKLQKAGIDAFQQQEQGFFDEGPARIAGRTARSLASGVASVLDAPRLVTDPLMYGIAEGAEALGLEGVERFARGEYKAPTAAERVRGGVDRLTDNQLQPRNIYEQVGDVGAELTAAVATPGATKKLLSGTKKLAKKVLPTADEIRQLASQSYQKAREVGGIIKAEKVDDIANMARSKLLTGDVKIDQSKSMKPLRDALDDIDNLRGEPMTLERAQYLDELLGDMIDSQTELGRLNKVGKKIYDVQTAFRGMLDDISDDAIEGGTQGFEALKKGRQLWTQQAKLRDIEKIIERAAMTDNPQTALKTGFRALASNPKRLRGYTAEERQLIERAAKTGNVTEWLRTGASRLLPIGAAVSGAGVLPTAGAMIGSQAARAGATALQSRRASDVARAIANRGITPSMRSPLGADELLRGVGRVKPNQPPSILNRLMRDESGSVGGLPMDKASRMARAKAQGFDVDNPVYHGTATIIESFSPSKSGALGRGVYLTTRSDKASSYADIAKTFGRGAEENVIKAVKATGRLADEDDFINAVSKYNKQGLRANEAKNAATKELERRGFIGIQGKRGLRKDDIVIFDPKNIRSVNAAFDPAKAASSDLLAQRLPLTAGGAGAGGLAATGTPDNAQAGIFDDYDNMQAGQTTDDALNALDAQRPVEEGQILPGFRQFLPEDEKNEVFNRQPMTDTSLDSVEQLLDKIAFAESSGNPNAKAKTSSASGLFQFTNGTWNSMVKKYGEDTGIQRKDKNNPDAQRTMAKLLLEENRVNLKGKIKREPSPGELYIAHFMGPFRASKLINALDENPPAIRLVPREYAKANRSIFYDGNRPRRAQEVYDLLTNKVT